MYIIANPSSRSGRGKLLWSEWKQLLHQHKIPFVWQVTHSKKHCIRLAQEANRVTVAVGGDGTINNVINGIMQAEQKHPLGILYAGTSPDFCKFHNIPTTTHEAMAALLQQHVTHVDISSINMAENEQETSKYFACSCNIGLGARIARIANAWRKFLGDAIGTGLGVLIAMLTYKPFVSTLHINGSTYTFTKTNHIIIVKNPYIASGVKINIPITPTDGKLYAIVIHNHTRWQMLRLFSSLYKGTLLQNPNIIIQECTHIQITTSPQQEVEFDGDPQGHTPVHIKIIPQTLPLICNAIRD